MSSLSLYPTPCYFIAQSQSRQFCLLKRVDSLIDPAYSYWDNVSETWTQFEKASLFKTETPVQLLALKLGLELQNGVRKLLV